MHSDEIWRNIDEQRIGLANLLEALTPGQWTSPSLCQGWQVRHVAAHLTHSHMGPLRVMVEAVKSGFRFDSMINRLALDDPRTQSQIVAAMRGMVGSRRRIVGTSALDPLTDMLVHGQDIAVPLGIERPVPVAAAVASANHLWRMRFPMHPAASVRGVRLVATDVEFAVGRGYEVRAPIREILLVLAGRRTSVSGEVDAHRDR
ncbi:maleylpyruvate isomerase family mycothiol-dependent enzyme [Mycolicibacterium sp. CH28]|nr:maleylpyruvate isomerase family mycothiol-dependent enzyme [Mycolicibacterium sp. CH28]TGD83903.1 maleylpyruvate isomerase family mycothiol-dependent enzyme [Mycolicibacterium sp. CH28]